MIVTKKVSAEWVQEGAILEARSKPYGEIVASLSDIADEIESSVVDAINGDGDGCEPTASPVEAAPVNDSGLAEELGVVEQSSDICEVNPNTDGFTNGDEGCVG